MRSPLVAAIAAVGIGLSATTVFAADLPRPVPVYTKAPGAAPNAPFGWNGFYAGVSAGGVGARNNDTWTANFDNGAAFTDETGSNRLNRSGVIVGGQIGYNWIVSPQWLLGLESDWSYTGIKGAHDASAVFPGTPFGSGFHSDLNSHWLATVRGRIGYTAGDWLFYGAGGLAIAGLRTNDAFSIPEVGLFISNSSSSSNAGWTAGGGVEYAFSRAWSAKVEYLYVDVKGNDYVLVPPDVSVAVHHDHLREHIVRVGVNYHLGN
jgi:outer membrane immunogenic protein